MFAKRPQTRLPPRPPFAFSVFFFFLIAAITCTDVRSSETPVPCPVVTGADEAPKGRFPYMCSIRTPENGDHECGGTLIKPRWLLTAAHCVNPNATDSTSTSLLIYCDIHRRNEHRSSKTYSARDIYVHSQWESEVEKGFDIALIELDQEADLPVPKLDTEMSSYGPGTKFTVLGWGHTTARNCTDKLQIGLDLNVLTRSICNNPKLWAELITESMICAGLAVLDTAKSDSGGPLLKLHKPGGRFEDGDPSSDVLAGIASFGDDINSKGNVSKPEVYSSVGFFRDWIDCIIEGNIPREECLNKSAPEPRSSEISSVPPLSFLEISPAPELSFLEISPAPEPSFSEISPDPEPPVYPTDTGNSVLAPEVEDITCFELLGDDFEEKYAQKRMRDAIEKDDSVTVECILDEGLLDANMTYIPPIRILPSYRTSFLHRTAWYNAVRSAKVLVDYGADVDIRDGQERAPLHIAAESDSLGVAKVLVREGAKLNIQSRRGDSPLHFAAFYGHQPIVKFIIQQGADVNSKNANGETPSHISAAKGFLSIVELLLDNGASKAVTNESGETPFDVICKSVDRNAECNEETRTRLEDLLSID